MSHSRYVLAALIFIIEGLATPYEDYGRLVHTYINLFSAIFCLRTMVFLLCVPKHMYF
jgi:hypothetical protein